DVDLCRPSRLQASRGARRCQCSPPAHALRPRVPRGLRALTAPAPARVVSACVMAGSRGALLRLSQCTGRAYIDGMSPLRARVEKGRLVLDEPTTVPEGTVIDL